MATWLIVLVLIILTILAKKPGSLKGKSSTLSPTTPSPSPTPAAPAARAGRTAPTPTAWWKVVVWITITIAVVGFLMAWVFPKLQYKEKPRTPIATPSAAARAVRVPAEIAIPAICGCESSGVPGVIRHFEKDGRTPLANRAKPGKKPSSAIGGCQILSDLHEERARKMGFEIRTPKGNLGYAKVLYEESDPPTKHWEGEPGNSTKGCWEPKLNAWQRGTPPGKVETYQLEVGKEWTGEITTPELLGHKMSWGPAKYNRRQDCEFVINDSPTIYDCDDSHIAAVKSLRVRSRSEPFTLEVKLWRKSD